MTKSVSAIVLLVIVSFVNGYSDSCVGQPTGTTIKHPKSHVNYFVCNDDTAVQFTCDFNYYFSDILGECIQMNGILGDEDTEFICVEQPDGYLIPNPESCSEFFLCLFDVAVPSTCPEPQYFNPETRICDDPANVACGPNICDKIPNGQLLNDPDSCSHFFICIDNEPRSGQCPLGLYFDKHTMSCQSPDVADCDTPQTTEEPDTTTAEPLSDACVGIPDGILVDNPTACAAFYLCMNDYAISGICPAPALFNPNRGMCDRPENVFCLDFETTTESLNLCYGETDFTFVDDPRTCEGYFLCFNGQSISRTCPDEYYFNPSMLICSPADEVACGETTTTEEPTTITTEVITKTEEAITTTEEAITTTEAAITTTEEPTKTITEETSTIISIAPDNCPPTGMIRLPDQQRCSLFIQCASGVEINMSCEIDHHFNFNAQTCLHRDIANCELPLPVCVFEQSSSQPIVFHHPQYCDKFFICFLGQITRFQCGIGLHFDIGQEQCSPEEEVGCESF